MYVGQMRPPGNHGPGRNFGGYPYKGWKIKLRHPPARIPASHIHESCLSCRGLACIPPVDPRGILYVGIYNYHGLAQVMVLVSGYQSCTYLGYEGGTPRVRLIATDGEGVL